MSRYLRRHGINFGSIATGRKRTRAKRRATPYRTSAKRRAILLNLLFRLINRGQFQYSSNLLRDRLRYSSNFGSNDRTVSILKQFWIERPIVWYQYSISRASRGVVRPIGDAITISILNQSGRRFVDWLLQSQRDEEFVTDPVDKQVEVRILNLKVICNQYLRRSISPGVLRISYSNQ